MTNWECGRDGCDHETFARLAMDYHIIREHGVRTALPINGGGR